MRVKMQIFVINLARSTDRLEFQRRQLGALGQSYERVEAVSADKASPMRTEAYWESWERPLMATERACLMSHVAVWERIARTGKPALVLEDDAVLSRRLPSLLRALEGMTGMDHLSLEVRGRKKLLGRRPRDILPGLQLLRLYQDRTGAAAYVLWPEGARKLLSRASRGAALADALICSAHELSSWQVEPAQACQLDMCGHYGLGTPNGAQSVINSAGIVRNTSHISQKWRRIVAQFQLGWRLVYLALRASRRAVALEPSDYA